MRHLTVGIFAALLVLSGASAALAQPVMRPDPNAERAVAEYRQGWQQLRSERYEEAVASFRRALELNPRLNLAHYGLGRSYMALKRYTEAIKEYTVCRDNYLADATRASSSQFERNRARQDRLMELRELASQYSTGPQTALTADVSRQIQNAIRTTQDGLNREMGVESIETSVPAFISVALGSAYFRADRMPDAEKAYKAALAADSKAGEAHNNLAVIYYLTGRIPDAEQSIKSAEKSGFKVNPELKDQIKAAKKTS